MQREIVIHIGFPKSGSTALQTFFSQNREQLLGHSVDYLPIGQYDEGKSGRIASGNGAFLARSMLTKNNPAFLPWEHPRIEIPFRSAVETSREHKLLLSSELFSFAPAESWSNFLGTCENMNLNVRLVAVVRNHCDLLSSAYVQEVKRHRVARAPADQIRKLYRKSAFLRYHTYLSMLSAASNGRVQIVSYDKAAARGALITDFLSILGISSDRGFVIAHSKINISPEPQEVAFLKLCNTYSPRMNFSDILAHQHGEPSKKGRPPTSWTVIAPKLRDEIQRFFSDEVQRLIKDFNLDQDFFSPPCTNYVDIDQLKFDASTLASILARYLVALDARIETLTQHSREQKIDNP